MASDIFGLLRTIGLIIMIVAAVLLEALLIWQGVTFWAWFWGICVILGVIVAEIWSYAVQGKTISTEWRDWAKKQKGWAYTGLALMLTAFCGLILHLAVWGGMKKRG
jgi:hypothetical protein